MRPDGDFIIYADESEKRGSRFENFYGGVILPANDLTPITKQLRECKTALNLHGEIKWTKVSAQYLQKYVVLMDVFFDLVQADRLKTRIMFSKAGQQPRELTREQRDDRYFIFYYQFIKHAFGLSFAESSTPRRNITLFLDQFPESKEKAAKFKGYVAGLTHNPQFRARGLAINQDDIIEVRSHHHEILQCLDVVLGAMQFQLNGWHKLIPAGQRIRGKKTRAKEKLYKHIRSRIIQIRPNFNVGISTGTDGNITNRWHYPYMHWQFRSKK